jgi:phosphoglycolate phosphatase-like HAD superfamily hydrolase
MRESYCPFLDVDDTIIMGSTPMMNWCYQQALQSVGIELYDLELTAATEEKWGAAHQEQFAHILGGDEERIKVANAAYWNEFETTFVDSVHFLPGTAEALRSFNVQPALLTGNHPEILAKVFKKIGIDMDLFDPIVTSYDRYMLPDLTKPNPYMIHEAIRRRKEKDIASPSDVVMVGDSFNDMRMANAAGAKALAVLTGRMTLKSIRENQEQGDPDAVEIDAVVKDIREVPAMIEELAQKNRMLTKSQNI